MNPLKTVLKRPSQKPLLNLTRKFPKRKERPKRNKNKIKGNPSSKKLTRPQSILVVKKRITSL